MHAKAITMFERLDRWRQRFWYAVQLQDGLAAHRPPDRDRMKREMLERCAPATEIGDEPRTDVAGVVISGDVLP